MSGLTRDEASAFVKRLVTAWDESDTCAGHVLGEHDRAVRAEALLEAADRWQTGEWTVLTPPIKAETQPQRIIGAAQAVTEWLRDRAARITEPASHEAATSGKEA